LALICIDQRSSILRHISIGKHFGVNVLGESQRELSIKFSQDCNNRFNGVEWYPGRTGVPLFFRVPAIFECQTVQMWIAGDHSIILGKVLWAHSSDKSPLAYVNRSYGKIVDPQTV